MFSSFCHPEACAFYYHWKTRLARKAFPAFKIREILSVFSFCKQHLFLLLLRLRWAPPSLAPPEARGTWAGAGGVGVSAATWPAWCLLPWRSQQSEERCGEHLPRCFSVGRAPKGNIDMWEGEGRREAAHGFIYHNLPCLSLEFLKENITEPSVTSSFHLNI